jgi:hypothetical protein
MGESFIKSVAISILRGALIAGGAWFVRKGWVEDGAWAEAAGGVAVIVVTQVCGWWFIHKRVLIRRWEILIGLESDAETAPQVITAEAKARYRDGWIPPPAEPDNRTQDF